MAGLLDAFKGGSWKDVQNARLSSLVMPQQPTPSVMNGYQEPVAQTEYANTEEPLGPPSVGPVSLDPTDYIGPKTLANLVVAAKAAIGPALLGGLMATGKNNVPRMMGQSGQIAWHGSPHKFDKFSLDKIGTGEGAQAYGHGLYLAENPKVAQEYSKLNPAATVTPNRIFQGVELVPGSPEYHAGTLLERSTLPAARKEVAGWIAEGTPDANALEGWKKTLETLNKATKKSDFKVGKNENLYKTDIPDEAVARFLDWDKPLSQQAPEVQAAIGRLKNANPSGYQKLVDAQLGGPLMEQATGRDLYQSLGRDAFNDSGIPGIRYLDGGSRSAGQGSSNFVAFDPEMIRILERNGQATGLEPWKPGEYRLKDLIGSGLLKGLLSGAALMGGIKSVGKKQAREVYTANKEIFDNAHKADNLSFQALPIQETSEAVSIYRSPRYGGKAPSEYMVGMVNGEPAYIRKSDHWGKFTTNIKEGTAEAKAAGLGDEIGDQFGRVGYKPHNWELQGGISSQHADRIATAQAFRDALPEAQRFGEIGNRLWDELYALTKPGKREAGYIPLSKLLGNRTE